MTTKQVCEYLHISHDTLRRRVKSGLIVPLPAQNPALFNEAKRFSRADVEKLKHPVTESAPATP